MSSSSEESDFDYRGFSESLARDFKEIRKNEKKARKSRQTFNKKDQCHKNNISDAEITEDDTLPSDLTSCRVLLLSCSTDLHIGLDMCFWKVSQKFLGIKYIPPGTHFLYWNPPINKDPKNDSTLGNSGKQAEEFITNMELDMNLGRRHGVFFSLKPGEVLVRRWDKHKESFQTIKDKNEEWRYVIGVKNFDFDSNMANFPRNYVDKWKNLTDYISPTIIKKIEPCKKLISRKKKKISPSEQNILGHSKSIEENSERGSSDSESMNNPLHTRSTKSRENDISSDDSDNESSVLFYSDIPRPTSSKKNLSDMTCSEITNEHMDKSSILRALLAQDKDYILNNLNLLGELQFAYVTFLFAYNYDSLIQWKSLLNILSESSSFVEESPGFYGELIRVLYNQLLYFPRDFFKDESFGMSFMTICLRNLHEITSTLLYEKNEVKSKNHDILKLDKRINALSKMVKDLFDIDISDDYLCVGDDNFGPTVVDDNDLINNKDKKKQDDCINFNDNNNQIVKNKISEKRKIELKDEYEDNKEKLYVDDEKLLINEDIESNKIIKRLVSDDDDMKIYINMIDNDDKKNDIEKSKDRKEDQNDKDYVSMDRQDIKETIQYLMNRGKNSDEKKWDNICNVKGNND